MGTQSGREIAEWIMRNHAQLNLKYVIWGQKIWDVRKDTVKPWNSGIPWATTAVLRITTGEFLTATARGELQTDAL